MKKILKWTAIGLAILIVIAFFGFLYLIPPFTLAPPDSFSLAERNAYPSLAGISDAGERRIAQRGRYLVQTIGCTGCHTPGGDKGPKYDSEFLAGGMKLTEPGFGTAVSRNLTPDSVNGLGRRSTAQVLRTLRCGLAADDGRIFNPDIMPWAAFSHMTEEDRYAIVVFLRHLQPVRHGIPPFTPVNELPTFGMYGGDYGVHTGK
ncbi:MAG TPA: c-type cytochrome [Bacteroidota bacterium]|nr:c-type cytochrome [Bacteroidota bacterium]